MASASVVGFARGGRGLNRARVVEAAAALADADGLDTLSLTRLAASLGVTQPALYNHVRSAADCVAQVGVTAREELADRIRTAARGRQHDAAVTAAAVAWRRYARRHPGRYTAADRKPATDADAARAADRVHQALVRVVATYGLAGETAERLAGALQGALRGLAALEREHGDVRWLDAASDELLTLLMTACRAAAAELAVPATNDRSA